MVSAACRENAHDLERTISTHLEAPLAFPVAEASGECVAAEPVNDFETPAIAIY